MIRSGVTYDQPVDAKLVVQLSNGRKWDATAEDLAKFGLDSTLDVYSRVDDALRDVLANAGLLGDRRDITESALNSVRYLVETAINYPDLLNHPEHKGWAEVVLIERTLREAWGGIDPPEPKPAEWDDPLPTVAAPPQ